MGIFTILTIIIYHHNVADFICHIAAHLFYGSTVVNFHVDADYMKLKKKEKAFNGSRNGK